MGSDASTAWESFFHRLAVGKLWACESDERDSRARKRRLPRQVRSVSEKAKMVEVGWLR